VKQLKSVSRKGENNKKISLMGILLGICIISVVLVAYGQISILQRNASALEADNDTLLNQITDLQVEKANLEQQVTSLQTSINSLSSQVANLQSELTTLQNQVANLETEKMETQELLVNLRGYLVHLELQVWHEHLLVRQAPHIV